MSDSDYRSYHHGERHHRSDRDYRHHDYRGHHARDSRDSYRNDYSQKRVPGLVSDPDTNLGDIENAIRRGQRETITRVQSDRYSPSRHNNTAQDAVTAMTAAPYYPTAVNTVYPYYSSSMRGSYREAPKRKFFNPGFLAFLPGLAGLALLITAVVLVNWSVVTTNTSLAQLQINYKGLFHVCTSFSVEGSFISSGCVSSENFADAGTLFSDLQQATRALIIIAAIVSFVADVVSFVLGLNKLERSKGALVAGGLHALAGACGVAAMGCYSSVLLTDMNAAAQNGVSFVLAGTSFYFGWVGTGLVLIASITSFMAHCARWKG